MFEVEKPRQFHYQPRFYDPEKEKWEALKKKYAIEQEKSQAQATETAEGEEDELQYFQRRVKDLEQTERKQSAQLSWRDLFRKREMPKFNYQPRFQNGVDTHASAPAADNQEAAPNQAEQELVEKYRQHKQQIKIKRRFDISDTDYMKPISGTKIILYCFIVFLLITLIIRF
ncbi:MAG: hypothetical protein MJZ67_03190 [Bacteroidales bacterium]|nr:hypothetical protein [Bacteroidales bacterium]